MIEVTIRPERAGDEQAIYLVNAEAFETEAEAKLVDELRRAGANVVSLVAEVRGEMVGHVLFTEVTVESQAGEGDWTAVGLAPVAVLPGFQGEGIGGRLCRAGLEACREKGYGVAIVLGHADYYPRFGFEPGVNYGIRWEHEVPDDVFMVMELCGGALAGTRGVVKFHKAFEGV